MKNTHRWIRYEEDQGLLYFEGGDDILIVSGHEFHYAFGEKIKDES